MALVGVVMLLSVPLLFGKDDWTDPVVRTAFVLTSLVVGLREEIVYRAIVQNLLEERLGKAGAILLASAVFALYHYGFGGWPYTCTVSLNSSCLAVFSACSIASADPCCWRRCCMR